MGPSFSSLRLLLASVLLTGFPYLHLGPNLLLVNAGFFTPFWDLISRMNYCYEGTFKGAKYDSERAFAGFYTKPYCSVQGYGEFGDDRSLTCEVRFNNTNCLTKRACEKITECHFSPDGNVVNLPGLVLVAWLQRYYILSLANQEYPDARNCLENAEFRKLVPNGCAVPTSPAVEKIWYTGPEPSIKIIRSAPGWSTYLDWFLFFACIVGIVYNGYRWRDSVPNVTLPSGTSLTQWAGDRWTSASEAVASRSAPFQSSVSQWWNRSLAAASRASAGARSSQAEETSMTAGEVGAMGSSLAMTPQQDLMAASPSGSQTSLQEQPSKPTAEVQQEPPGLASTSAPMNAQPLASQMASQETAQKVALPPSVEQQTNVPNDRTERTEQPQQKPQVVLQPQPEQKSQVQPQPQAQQQAQPQPMASNELPSDGSSPLLCKPTAQEIPAVGQPDNFSPQHQLAYSPQGPPPPGHSGPGLEQPQEQVVLKPQQQSQIQPQEQLQVQAQQQAPPQHMASNGSSPLAYQPTAQENPALGQPDTFYPQQQLAYPPRGPPPPGYSGPGPRGFQPRSAGFPPRPGGFPPGPRGYPPGPHGFPPRSAGYAAPGPRGFPPRSAGFPPGPRGYPPRSAGNPAPGPRGFPPRSAEFPPRPGGYPPPPGGYGRGMPGPRSASGGQMPGAFPPRSPGLPPANRGYAPAPGGFPPRSAGYAPPGPRGFPPRSAGFPPGPGGIPPQSGGFSNSPRGYPPRPGGFPLRSAGYGAPGPRGFPPRSAGYPPPGPRGYAPGPGGLPPRSAGFDPRMARPGSASGGQWPRPG